MQQEDQNQTSAEQGANNQADKKPGSLAGIMELITRIESAANPHFKKVNSFINDLIAESAISTKDGALLSQEDFDKEVDNILKAVAMSVGTLAGKCSDEPSSVVGMFVTELCRAVEKGELLARIHAVDRSDNENAGAISEDHKCETCDSRETCPVAEKPSASVEPVGDQPGAPEPQSADPAATV